MLPFRRILFPVDYSEPCLATVPHVHAMARHHSAELALVHAYALQPSFASSGPYGAFVFYETSVVDPKDAKALELDRLREFASKMFPGRHVDLLAEEGEPGSVIHDVVQHYGTDLLMLPTHGRGPVRRLL